MYYKPAVLKRVPAATLAGAITAIQAALQAAPPFTTLTPQSGEFSASTISATMASPTIEIFTTIQKLSRDDLDDAYTSYLQKWKIYEKWQE